MTNQIIAATPPAYTNGPDQDRLHQDRPPQQRHDGWTAARQRQFCEALAECGVVDKAAASAGMSRESAYRLRRRSAGKAFALAWDAALLLARQRLIDEAFELAFTGSVEQIIRNGKVIAEKRKRDPRMMLMAIERLSGSKILGSAVTQSVAQEFDIFLDCMERDAAAHGGYSASFVDKRQDDVGMLYRRQFAQTSNVLRNADNRADIEEKQAATPELFIHQNSNSV